MGNESFLALFDLDGTLVDPQGAITEGVAGALAQIGVEVPSEELLRSFVGPPLASTLRETLGLSPAQIRDVINIYRERYITDGFARSEVYPGIVETLDQLRTRDIPMAVVTQKPQDLAVALLSAKALTPYFAGIYGAKHEEGEEKATILARALQSLRSSLGGQLPQSVMVGDRRFDMEAALANRVNPIGVLWGFGSAEELRQAGAAGLVSEPAQLQGEFAAQLSQPAHPAANA